MNRHLALTALAAFATGVLFADGVARGTAVVTVDPATVVGPIKPINGVNNGPTLRKDGQELGVYSKTYADAKIPYARTHDAAFYDDYGGAHTIDISAVFPDFSKDPDDPKSYDFTFTDRYMKGLLGSGTKVYYRLGQKIEHLEKKYHLKPADNLKWARVCEHLIMHFNEGWADGHRWNVTDFEIWNEPDNNFKSNPECWSGTDEEFFEFFATAYTHLKGRFPNLRFGGPGIMYVNKEWEAKFFPFLKSRGIVPDFFSWHAYRGNPRRVGREAVEQRKILDDAGFAKTESHLTEWNYIQNFADRWEYSLRVERGEFAYKGGAYVASVLTVLQDSPVDVAHYYDARPCGMNGMYNEFLRPIQGYYAFYAWAKLRELGTQVAVKLAGLKEKDNTDDMYVTAATDGKGRLGVLIARFIDDNNVVVPKEVRFEVPGYALSDVVIHETGHDTMFTERPWYVKKDGTNYFMFEPSSFVYVSAKIEKAK